MATEVIMPQMGFDVTEAKLVRWLKGEGDQVNRGEPIAEIETEKSVLEVEAFGSGVLRRILLQPGQVAPVGQVIAVIAAADEQIPEEAPPERPARAAPQPAPEREAPPPREKVAERREVIASPVARRMADEASIDLREVEGTGPDGRITKSDVEAYLERKKALAEAAPARPEAAPPPPEGAPIELSRMRQAIARRMSQSKREAPHFYTTVQIDMTEAMRLREEMNKTTADDPRISVNDLVLRATAMALLKYPDFNSFYNEGRIQRYPRIDMGVATALEEGLIVPAIINCGNKGLREIARASADLARRAREGRIKAEEYTSTFSVTNLGMYDVDNFIAIINPPQAAVLAVGAVQPTPVVREGQVVVAQMMKMTLSADHRVTDGAQAAQFLRYLKELLQKPLLLLM